MNKDNVKLKDIYTDAYNYYKEMDMPHPVEAANKEVVDGISEHVEELVDVTNSSAVSYDMMAEGIVKGILKSHRYLQNEFVIALTQAIEKYGNVDENQTDPRNQYAVADCKTMSDALNKARE